MTKERVYSKEKYGKFESRMKRYERLLTEIEIASRIDYDISYEDSKDLAAAVYEAQKGLYILMNQLKKEVSDEYVATF